MIFLVTGTDWIWKTAFLEWATEKWPKPIERIWCDEVEEDWLLSYLQLKNHVILRNCNALSDKPVEYILEWRNREMIFEAIDLKTGPLRRKLIRAGRHFECNPGTEQAKTRILDMAKRMGAGSVGERLQRGCESLTEAYWACHLWKLGTTPQALLPYERKSYAKAVVAWEPDVMNKSIEDLLNTVRGLTRIATLTKEGQTKWRLVQEAINVDHSQVGPLYGEGVNLSNNADARAALVRRMQLISKYLEEEPSSPVEFLYLVAR